MSQAPLSYPFVIDDPKDFLGYQKYLGSTNIAFNPYIRRLAWDNDGTICYCTQNGGFTQGTAVKKFSVDEMKTLNSENTDWTVGGAETDIFPSGIGYNSGDLTFLFPQSRVITGVWYAATPSGGVARSTQDDPVNPTFIKEGWFANPDNSGNPKPTFATDAQESETLAGIEGSFAPVSDLTANDFWYGTTTQETTRINSSGVPQRLDITSLVKTLPSYRLYAFKLRAPITCNALRIPWEIANGNHGVTFAAVHLYGYFDDSELRVCAFTDSAGAELEQDISFGMIPREVPEVYGPSSLQNQDSALYVTNITNYKFAKGVSVSIDGDENTTLSNYTLLSLDGESWTPNLVLGDIDPGEKVGPIYVKLEAEVDSGRLNLVSGRLKITVFGVE